MGPYLQFFIKLTSSLETWKLGIQPPCVFFKSSSGLLHLKILDSNGWNDQLWNSQSLRSPISPHQVSPLHQRKALNPEIRQTSQAASGEHPVCCSKSSVCFNRGELIEQMCMCIYIICLCTYIYIQSVCTIYVYACANVHLETWNQTETLPPSFHQETIFQIPSGWQRNPQRN